MWYRSLRKAVRELSEPLITRHKTKGLYGVPVWGITLEKDPTVNLGAGSKVFGPGHYTSLNPNVTEGYSGRYTRLEVIPAGARILQANNIPGEHVIRIIKKLQELDLVSPGRNDEYLLNEAEKFNTLESIGNNIMGYSKKYLLNSVLLSLGYDAIQYPTFTRWNIPKLPGESEEEYGVRVEKIKSAGDNILILNRAMLAVPRLFEKSRFSPDSLSYSEIDKLQSEMYLSERELIKVLPEEDQIKLMKLPEFFNLFDDEELIKNIPRNQLLKLFLSEFPSVKNRVRNILGLSEEEIYTEILQNENAFSVVFKSIDNANMKKLLLLDGKYIPNEIYLQYLGKYIAGQHFKKHPRNVTFEDNLLDVDDIDENYFEEWFEENNLKDENGNFLSEAEKNGVILSALEPGNYYREYPIHNYVYADDNNYVLKDNLDSLKSFLSSYIEQELNELRSYCFQCENEFSIKDLESSCTSCGYDGHGYRCLGCSEYRDEPDGDCEHCGYPDYKCPECGAEGNFDSCNECGRNIFCPSCEADYYVAENGCDACGGPFQCSGCGAYFSDDNAECDCGYQPDTNDEFGD